MVEKPRLVKEKLTVKESPFNGNYLLFSNG
jgi:hypothetical protein